MHFFKKNKAIIFLCGNEGVVVDVNDGRAEEHAVAAVGHAAVARDEAAKVLQKIKAVSCSVFSIFLSLLPLPKFAVP